jgi:hypothetical protein
MVITRDSKPARCGDANKMEKKKKKETYGPARDDGHLGVALRPHGSHFPHKMSCPGLVLQQYNKLLTAAVPFKGVIPRDRWTLILVFQDVPRPALTKEPGEKGWIDGLRWPYHGGRDTVTTPGTFLLGGRWTGRWDNQEGGTKTLLTWAQP